ncbi:MAG: DNA-processing protein DprA [Chloroflexota bacterium]
MPDDQVAAANRDALAVLVSVDGVGPATLESLLAAMGSAADVVRVAAGTNGAGSLAAALRDAGSEHVRVARPTLDGVVQAARAADSILAGMHSSGVHALAIEDAAYPSRLRTIELPPRVLFVRGADAALDAADVIAVVGTRRPTDVGRRTASRIGAALARAGALVVSGLALGIDGVAHAAALEASGTTVAVIGGGHGRLAPVTHDRLAAAIVDRGGAVISEHAPDTRPTRGTFPRRNRIISGLADAVIVVEAGARSGALLTAAWALEQGRECFLVPGTIEDPESAGCLAWLREYSGLTRIVAGVPQLLEDLGLVATAGFPPRDERGGHGADPAHASHHGMRPPGGRIGGPSVDAVVKDLADREGRLVLALAAGASTTDELAAIAQMPIGAVLAGLTVLEGRGLIRGAYGRYEFTINGPSMDEF